MTGLTNVLYIHSLKRNRNIFSKHIENGCLYSFTIGTSKDDGRLPLSNLTIKINNNIIDIYNEYNDFNTGNIEFKLSDYIYYKSNDIEKFEVQYKYNNNEIDCYVILNLLSNFNSLGEKKKTNLIDIDRKCIEK